MKKLKDILYKTTLESVHGSTDVTINKVAFDSREVSQGDLFVAIKGTLSDGHKFIDKAIEMGAIAIVCEMLPTDIKKNITYVEVLDSAKSLAFIADNYYEHPSQNLKLIGVTGTNGKTTVASLLYDLFKKAGYKVGLLSTVVVKVDETIFPATHTTPDPLKLNFYLNEMSIAGVEFCFMEVSSHGIAQHRSTALHFAGGVFTNLTQDHLDYHNSFAEYRNVKKRFFDELPKSAFALTNKDDKNGLFMLQNTSAKKYTYALKSFADYRATVLENELSGLLMKINEKEVWSRLIGSFNAYNITAIFAVAELLGLQEYEILKYISELHSVDGRFQYTISPNNITAIVDYAHTPDALKNVLETINAIRSNNETLITVVGCGGNRDKDKRPKMGHIATALSNKAIFTSDNPRNEVPETIIDDMERGVEPQNQKKLVSITDRKQAIKTACQMAQTGDIILVAGKGHETYQEINGQRYDFNDFEIVQDYLKQLQK